MDSVLHNVTSVYDANVASLNPLVPHGAETPLLFEEELLFQKILGCHTLVNFPSLEITVKYLKLLHPNQDQLLQNKCCE